MVRVFQNYGMSDKNYAFSIDSPPNNPLLREILFVILLKALVQLISPNLFPVVVYISLLLITTMLIRQSGLSL